MFKSGASRDLYFFAVVVHGKKTLEAMYWLVRERKSMCAYTHKGEQDTSL